VAAPDGLSGRLRFRRGRITGVLGHRRVSASLARLIRTRLPRASAVARRVAPLRTP
jgi:hypothetical protein